MLLFLSCFFLIDLGKSEISYIFSGTLSSDWGTLTAGTPFQGSFSYDYPQSSSSIWAGGGILQITYEQASLSVSIGEETLNFTSPGLYEVVVNSLTVSDSTTSLLDDRFLIGKTGDGSFGNRPVSYIGVNFIDNTTSLLNTAFLADSYDFMLFGERTLIIGLNPGDGTEFQSISSNINNVAMVPEPSALSLIAADLS